MNALSFRKMHGLGNDFAIFDARAMGVEMTPALVRAIADRRRGVGCDQVIVIAEPRRDDDANAEMLIWNPDGSSAEQCGNATRCVAALLMEETRESRAVIRTAGGRLICEAADGERVAVAMGAPRFAWDEVPLAEELDTNMVDLKIGPIDDPWLFGPSAVSMGNPHCVFFVESLRAYDIEKIGPLVENHPLFPERTNVHLVQVLDPTRIRQQVWERGAGRTLASGSGACGAVAAAARKGLTERAVTVELDGGALDVEWRDSDGKMWMTGPVSAVYEARLDASLVAAAAAETVEAA